MAGWFSDSDEERARKIREREEKYFAQQKKKKEEKRRKQRAEFQNLVDKEVENRLEKLSHKDKEKQIELLKRSTNFLNAALGNEFANYAEKKQNLWSQSQKNAQTANSQTGTADSKDITKTADVAETLVKSPRLNRPF